MRVCFRIFPFSLKVSTRNQTSFIMGDWIVNYFTRYFFLFWKIEYDLQLVVTVTDRMNMIENNGHSNQCVHVFSSIIVHSHFIYLFFLLLFHPWLLCSDKIQEKNILQGFIWWLRIPILLKGFSTFWLWNIVGRFTEFLRRPTDRLKDINISKKFLNPQSFPFSQSWENFSPFWTVGLL